MILMSAMAGGTAAAAAVEGGEPTETWISTDQWAAAVAGLFSLARTRSHAYGGCLSQRESGRTTAPTSCCLSDRRQPCDHSAMHTS